MKDLFIFVVSMSVFRFECNRKDGRGKSIELVKG